MGGSPALFADLARLWRDAGGEPVVYTTRPDPLLAPVGAQGGDHGGITVRRFPARCVAPRRWAGRLLAAAGRAGPPPWQAALGFPHVLTYGYRAHLRRRAEAQDGPFRLVVGGVLPHVHFLEPAARLAARRRLPLMVIPLLHAGLLEVHGRRRVLGPAAGAILRGADAVVALTEAEREPLEAAGVPGARIHVLPLGLDGHAVPEAAGTAGPEPPEVIQVGALSAGKGTLVLLQAWERLARTGVGAVLILAGRPEPEVRRALSRLTPAVRSRVRLLEEPDDGERDEALSRAAVLAFPSRADAFGRVILEGWRHGVAPVVAAAGGPGRLVRQGVDGLIVPPDDPGALAAALSGLLADGARRRALGEAGRRRLQSQLTWGAVFPRWRDLLESLAGATAGGGTPP